MKQARQRVYSFVVCVAAQRETEAKCFCTRFTSLGGALHSMLCYHTSGRQYQNNISFCSTMEKSPKNK